MRLEDKPVVVIGGGLIGGSIGILGRLTAHPEASSER